MALIAHKYIAPYDISTNEIYVGYMHGKKLHANLTKIKTKKIIKLL